MHRNSFDQSDWHRLVDRKLEISFGTSILGDRFFKRLVAGDRRIQSDVILPSGIVDNDAVLFKCRHAITDHLLRIGNGESDSCADRLEYRLDFFGNVSMYRSTSLFVIVTAFRC